jgi:hypothetical protein
MTPLWYVLLSITSVSMLWITLGYGYAFIQSHNKIFLIHSLRWIMGLQYSLLLVYLFYVNVFPQEHSDYVVILLAGAVLGGKIIPMMLNIYSEGQSLSRNILLFKQRKPMPAKDGLFVPFNPRVDLLYEKEARSKAIVLIVLIFINCFILYGVVMMDKIT